MLKGLVAAGQGRTEDALAELLEAIRLNPKLAAAHYNLGGVLHEKGQTNDAIAEYREAIRLDPKNAYVRFNLGLIWYQKNRTQDAITEYREAIRLDPKFAAPHFYLGIIWDKQGRTEDAIAGYREAIRLDPTSPTPHHRLGQTLKNVGLRSSTLERKLRLQDACLEFLQTARLAREHPSSDKIRSAGRVLGGKEPIYSADIRDVDNLLGDEGRCPPQ